MSGAAAQAIANGVLLGGLYAALALGFSLVWRTNRVINLAHGELVMIGAYLTWALWSVRWLDPLPALAVVIPAMFAAGYVIERLLLRPLAGRRALASLLATLGLSVVLQQAARIVFSPTPHAMPLPVTGLWRVGPASVAGGRVMLLLASLGILAAAAVFLRATRLGRSVRAVAQNADAARLIGIDVARVRTLTFALCTAVAAAAGALIGQAQPIHPLMGPPLILRAFAITALAGPGNVTGALAGGIALGAIESLLAAFVPRIGANLGVIAACAILVIMLVVRRANLFERGQQTWAT